MLYFDEISSGWCVQLMQYDWQKTFFLNRTPHTHKICGDQNQLYA
jgi:hypothetical protein